MKPIVRAGALALALVCSTSTFAQSPSSSPNGAATQQSNNADRGPDRDFDLGWLGLIGLAGLAGLLRNHRNNAKAGAF